MSSILCTAGQERIAKLTIDDINYAAVGTGTDPLLASNTQLKTETYRKAPDYSLRQGKVIQSRTQMDNANLPATSEEFGFFMNGAAGADTGELLCRVLSEFAKNSMDLFVIFEGEIED